MPDSTEKTVPHGISNLNKVIEIVGFMYDSQPSFQPIPNANVNLNNDGSNAIYIIGNDIAIRTRINKSSASAYITLRYTKTS